MLRSNHLKVALCAVVFISSAMISTLIFNHYEKYHYENCLLSFGIKPVDCSQMADQKGCERGQKLSCEQLNAYKNKDLPTDLMPEQVSIFYTKTVFYSKEKSLAQSIVVKEGDATYSAVKDYLQTNQHGWGYDNPPIEKSDDRWRMGKLPLMAITCSEVESKYLPKAQSYNILVAFNGNYGPKLYYKNKVDGPCPDVFHPSSGKQ